MRQHIHGITIDAAVPDLVENLKPAFFGKTVTDIADVTREEAGGLRLTLLDAQVAYSVGSGDKERTEWATQTVALHDSANHSFPGFTLQPSNAMMEMAMRMMGVEHFDIDFDSHPAFSAAYLLNGIYPDNTRRLFDHGPLLDELGRRTGLHMGAELSSLVLYRWDRKFDAAGRKSFAAEAAAVFNRFEEAARAAQVKPAVKRDARAFAASVPGEFGERLRKSLVARADLGAFLGQPPPRRVPANIRASGTDANFMFFALVGAVIALAASLFVLFNVYPPLAAGRRPMDDQIMYSALACAFVALGIGVAAFAIRRGLRAQGLLRHGVLAQARIESISATGDSTNGVEEYLMQLRYQAGAQSVQAVCRISGVAVKRAKLLKAEGKTAPILHDLGDPQRVRYAEALLNLDPEIEP